MMTFNNQDQTHTLRAWLADAPFTLAMSSGFFGFYAHAGFLKALEHAHIRPAAVRGASAGSLIAALWAAGMSADEISKALTSLERRDFWDPYPGLGVLRGKKVSSKLASLLPVTNFSECRVPLTISAFDTLTRKTVPLSSGDLISAVRASCAVPLMFHPVWRDRRPLYDGGIADRPGIIGSASDERLLYHHLLPWAPWRSKSAASSQIPSRPMMRAVQIAGLPKVTPFRMERGPQAMNHAYDFTMKILDKQPDLVVAGAGIHGRPHA